MKSHRGIFEKLLGSGEWWIRYALANGKIRREKAGSKSAAIKLYRKRKMEIFEGKKLPQPRQRLVTFREIALDVLTYSRTHHRERTHYVAGCQVKRFIDQFRDTPADQITPQRLMEFLAGNTKTKATYNRWRSLLSLTYRWAIENGKVSLNPIHKVPRHKNEDNKRTRFLKPDEEVRLRKVIRKHWPEEEPILDLYLHTGLRGGNLFDLHWKDVDLELGLLEVLETKGGKPLFLEINSAARRAFDTLKSRRPLPSTADEHVCPSGYRHFTKWFKKALSQAEIQDFRPHDLRHTFGSRLTMRGVPLRTIQELMGHRDIATTLRYSHLSDAHRRAAVEELVSMTISTSNFAKSWRLPNAVAISRSVPGYFKGHRYLTLAPDRTILKLADPVVFDRVYGQQLAALNPQKVHSELVELAGEDAVLLCWESFNVRCHRRMVAEWLENALGVEIPELGHTRSESIAYRLQQGKPGAKKEPATGTLFPSEPTDTQTETSPKTRASHDKLIVM